MDYSILVLSTYQVQNIHCSLTHSSSSSSSSFKMKSTTFFLYTIANFYGHSAATVTIQYWNRAGGGPISQAATSGQCCECPIITVTMGAFPPNGASLTPGGPQD